MKKFNAIVILFTSFLIFSCSKNKEEVGTPQNDTKSKEETLPHFDESNSTKVTWDQLPAKLRNAMPLNITTENKNARTTSTSSTLRSQYSSWAGPWGGNGGSYFDILPPSGSRIYAMAIRAAAYVDRLIVWYQREDGSVYVGVDRGGNGGTYYVQYFDADEYISAVAGRTGSYVDRLTFYTNKKWFTYGGNGGSPFYTGITSGHQVLGFFGRSGIYIDKIGFHVYTR